MNTGPSIYRIMRLVATPYHGQHVYVDVAGKATTEVNIILQSIKEELFSCPDRFGLGPKLIQSDNTTTMTGTYVGVCSFYIKCWLYVITDAVTILIILPPTILLFLGSMTLYY